MKEQHSALERLKWNKGGEVKHDHSSGQDHSPRHLSHNPKSIAVTSSKNSITQRSSRTGMLSPVSVDALETTRRGTEEIRKSNERNSLQSILLSSPKSSAKIIDVKISNKPITPQLKSTHYSPQTSPSKSPKRPPASKEKKGNKKIKNGKIVSSDEPEKEKLSSSERRARDLTQYLASRKIAKLYGHERTQVLFNGQVRALKPTGEIEEPVQEFLRPSKLAALQAKKPVIYRDESVVKLINNDTMRYEQGIRQVMAENLQLSILTNQHIMMKRGQKKKRKEEI